MGVKDFLIGMVFLGLVWSGLHWLGNIRDRRGVAFDAGLAGAGQGRPENGAATP